MNFFLYINKKLIFFIGISILLIFAVLIFSKQFNFNQIEVEVSKEQLKNVDISEPKFAINNNSNKINITAKEGNFLNKDEVLLRKNVRFKSKDFSIETEKVIFNRNKQTANSEVKSLFKTDNTTIFSNGFDINNNGNNIKFHGNSKLILK